MSIVQSSAESQPNRRIMLISLLIETVRPYKKCSLEKIREHFAEKSIWFCYSYQGETRMKSKLGALYMQIASSSEKIFSLWFEIEKKRYPFWLFSTTPDMKWHFIAEYIKSRLFHY